MNIKLPNKNIVVDGFWLPLNNCFTMYLELYIVITVYMYVTNFH